MPDFKDLFTFESENEYESAYDLAKERNFSRPKIYSGKGDLKKRWYVYFSFRDPKTGKMKRQTPFYGIANKFKTKEDRLSVLVTYRKVLLRLLKEGYDPYGDNTELHDRLKAKSKPDKDQDIKSVTQSTPDQTSDGPKMSVQEAFDFAIGQKQKILSPTTKRGYENKIKNFLKWTEANRPDLVNITDLDKKTVTTFLNDVLSRTSARNRNNFRTDLSSVLQVLVDNDIIAQNFIKKIPVLKSVPKRHKRYSRETQEKIFVHLKAEDPLLLLYIKFISYNFLRPIEVCRLKVKDIDLKGRTVRFKDKNDHWKTKIIPDILWTGLPDIETLEKEYVLFTPDKIGGKWETAIGNRRDYFTKRFKRVVKDHFGLGTDYTLYSFRHTFITKLYRALEKGSSPFEAKSKLMLITGHSSMTSLEKYLRDIDAMLPEDYSTMLRDTDG
ncbi:tyrosine-type recombinase/integrase [Pareuzebyella sediminis]|uniref:tyrosine-type recombinase/integrase n=1 Tax=Pareuzebyella sediminis TaxID=2607998 RepID=UPI0011ED9DDC|nr:site-specific integrase [Pareuzebyella sediminis]